MTAYHGWPPYGVMHNGLPPYGCVIGPGRWEPPKEPPPIVATPELIEAAKRLAEQLQKLELAKKESPKPMGWYDQRSPWNGVARIY